MRRSAFESLQRGVANLLANWELLLVQLLATVVVSLLVIAGCVPPLLALGVGTMRALMVPGAHAGRLPIAEIDALVERLQAASGPLLVALLVATGVWTVALIASSYFQAGIFGVLAAGDRGSSSAGWRAGFRVFALRRFKQSAEHHLWRFFWLVNAFLLLGTVLVTVVAAVGLALGLLASDSMAGALGATCLTIALVAVVSAALTLWWQTSMAVSVTSKLSFRHTIGVGFLLLVRRLGAMTALLLAMFSAALAIMIVFVPLSLVVEVATRDYLAGYITAQIVMAVVQSVAGGAVGLAFSAAVVGLVGGELKSGKAAA